MQTIMPANRTARPEVSIDSIDRLLAGQAAQQPLPVAGDDEQRVVDADAEADQQRELARERGHVDHVREQADDRDAGTERQAAPSAAAAPSPAASRTRRTARPRPTRKPKPRPLDSLFWLPACGRPGLRPRTGRRCFDPEVTFETNAFAGVLGDLVRLEVEGHVRERDLARRGDLRGARRAVRRLRRSITWGWAASCARCAWTRARPVAGR